MTITATRSRTRAQAGADDGFGESGGYDEALQLQT